VVLFYLDRLPALAEEYRGARTERPAPARAPEPIKS